MSVNMQSRLGARGVSLGYDDKTIVSDLDVAIPDGSFTVLVGPNGCGKSTLLRGLARLLKPMGGAVLLDGKAISEQPTKQVARQIGLLPQTAVVPDGVAVSELVARGRYPHQNMFRQATKQDKDAVARAMEVTNTADLADRAVDELSGGQRQRVWVAMALAQETPILLLDEPTTYLDIAHQIELLDLFAALNAEGATMVAVLHDLNHAARYATHLVAMKAGQKIAEGTPEEIVTAENVERVFGLRCVVIPDPLTGSPMVVPHSAATGGEQRPDLR